MLFAWTTGATYWYVCEKRGLCSEVRQELDQLASISRQHLTEMNANNSGMTQSSLMPSFVKSKPKKTRKKETVPTALSAKSNAVLTINVSPIHLQRFHSSALLSLDDLICQVSEQLTFETITTSSFNEPLPTTTEKPSVASVSEIPKPVIPKPVIEKPLVKSPAPAPKTAEITQPKVTSSNISAPIAKKSIEVEKEEKEEAPVKGEGFYAVIGIYGDLSKATDRVNTLKKDGINAELLPHVAGLKKVAVFLDANAEAAAKKLANVRRTINGQSNLFYFNPEQ